MAFYDRTEPGQRDNELHSVIGTEVASISPELEFYYGKYFNDRQKVVSLNSKYIAVFKGLETQAGALRAQMDTLKSEIDSKTRQYNLDIELLNSDIQSFNYRSNNGGFDSEWQFNYERSVLAGRITNIQNSQATVNADVANYNAILAQYNLLATQSQQLYSSMDSTLTPTPSI